MAANLPLIARVQIPSGETRTLTTRTDLAVTVWIERGAVEVLAGRGSDAPVLAEPANSGPTPLGPGEIHLRNVGKSAALVFAAMVEFDRIAEAPGARGGGERSMPEMAGFEGPEAGAWVATCSKHGDLSGPGSRQKAERAVRKHLSEDPRCDKATLLQT